MKQVEKFIYPLFFVFLILIFLFVRDGEAFKSWNFVVLVISLLLLLFHGVRVIKAYGTKSVHGKSLVFLVSGLALSIVWTLLYRVTRDLVLLDIKLLTVSNLIGLTTYTLIFIGLIKELIQSKIKWTPKKAVSTFSIITVLTFVIMYFGLYRPSLRIGMAVSEGLSEIFIVCINMSIVALSVLLFVMIREYDKGKIVIPWLLILAGFFVRLMGDVSSVIFFEGFANETWPYINFSLLWPLCYGLYGYGLYSMKKVVDDINASLINKQAP